MTEHLYWIWAIFFIIPLVSIIRRYLRKRNMQNFSKSSEQYHEIQFKTNSSKIETPGNLLERDDARTSEIIRLHTIDLPVYINYNAVYYSKNPSLTITIISKIPKPIRYKIFLFVIIFHLVF